MARKLKKVEFNPRNARIYPWDDWSSGDPYQATKGKDYTTTTPSFRTSLHTKATALGMKVLTQTGKDANDNDTVTFQFFPDGREPGAKKTTVRARKAPAKKAPPASRKRADGKTTVKSPVGRKRAAKKTAPAKKTPAKKVPARKAVAKKTVARKHVIRKKA